LRYSCGHVSTKKNVRGIKDAAVSTPPQLRSSRYIRYHDNIGYPRYGENYNIRDNQYSSKNLSYCPINRFLESVKQIRGARTILLFHIISARPSKQPLMVYTFLKVYMELKRASSSMMSHSLCTHAVMLTVFNLVSTTPYFHHPFWPQASPIRLTSLLGASSSIPSSALDSPCSFLLQLAFPQKTLFPTCSNPLGVQSPFIGHTRLHKTQSFRVWIVHLHSSSPSSSRSSHKKTVGPCSFPQNRTVPLTAFGKKGGSVTTDSPCSCVTESRDCRANSTLHVGDRYPSDSISSW
jgi:hypothetical protein